MEKPVCSFCGSDVFMEITESGGAAVSLSAQSVSGEPLYYSICVKCGTVNRIYVKDPQKLFQKLHQGKWL